MPASGPAGLAPAFGISDKTTKALQFMVSQVGKPYIWGGEGPKGYDCTGLAVAGFRAAGIKTNRFTTASIPRMGKAVAPRDVLPGDAIMPTTSHVYWYIGSGKAVEAARSGTDVRIINFNPNNPGKLYTIRRIVTPGGNIAVGGDIGAVNGLAGIGDYGGALSAVMKLAEPLAAMAESLTNPIFWQRVAMFLGGVILVWVGLIALVGSGALDMVSRFTSGN